MQLSTLALTLALFTAPVVAPVDEMDVDFEALLEQAREHYELEDTDLASYSVAQLLDSDHFIKFELGPWDIRLPVEEVSDKSSVTILKEAVMTTLDVASMWADWTVLDEEVLEAVQEDTKVLKKWAKGWSNRAFRKSIGEDREGLFARMPSVDEKVLAAGQRFLDTMGLKPNVDGTPAAQVVFCPTRKTFVELSTLAGALEPKRKELLWGGESIFQTAAWSTNVHFIALEYAIWPWDGAHPENGDSMNALVKTGRDQHVVERMASSLSRGTFNSMASPLLEQALHINLVIDIVGEETPSFSTWSFQWSRAGGSTAPYSRFVPGGNAAGGVLPKRPAKAGPTTGTSENTQSTVWREKNGGDYYRSALEKGQKKGFKLAAKSNDVPDDLKRDRRAHFAIGILGKSEAIPMSAPFLGMEAEDKKVPEDKYIDEYEEFFRAYRTCFSHWLRTEGHPDGKAKSPEAFAKLLQRAKNRSKSDTLSSMVLEIYGLPLSAQNGETDSLEWRFLEFVAK